MFGGPMRRTFLYPTIACLLAGSFFFALIEQAFGQHAEKSPAQSVLPASLEQPGAITPQKREELQAELRRHAAVLEAQSAVLKTTSKLVGPSVVFIEAGREVQASLSSGNRSITC
jgi:hypothetical protein